MPTPQPLVLLPPSEGKAAGGDGPAWRRGAMLDSALDGHRLALLRAVPGEVVRRRAATSPAIERYTGVLYRELSWSSLSAAARRRGEERVRTVSGLWGLVAPADPLPPYRLKMSASVEGVGRLATWWRPRLAATLATLSDGATVWDLLPQEHAAAMDWSSCTPSRRVTVRFVDDQDRTVSHWNKLLKGALVRWLLTARPAGPEDLVDFVHPLGYRYDPAASELDGTLARVVLRQAPGRRPLG